MAALGLVPEDFADDAIDLWPENAEVVALFSSVPAGAWLVVPQVGAIGIRPEAMREVRIGCGVSDEQWQKMFSDFSVLERAALDTMKGRNGR